MVKNKFQEFISVDLEEFVNNSITKFEPSILQAELDKCINVKNDMERELYRTFLESSSEIIKILSLYDEMSYKADEYNKLVDSYNEVISSFRIDDDFVYVDEDRQKELFNLFNSFLDDMSCFKSPTRYLVHFDIFFSGKKQILVILSNDLVFMAESEDKSNFKLLNAFSYNVIDIKKEEKDLVIKSENHYYKLRKDEESVSKIVNLHEEFTFKPTYHVEETGDDELSDFLIKTEQYDKIEKISRSIPELYTKEEFVMCLKKMDPDFKAMFVTDFLNEKFRNGLGRINKIQFLRSLVEDAFEYFWHFQKEQNSFIKSLEDHIENLGPSKALLIERQLEMVSKFLEKRIFYNFNIKTNNNVLKMIEDKLINEEMDIRFLMIYFNFIKDDYFRGCIGNAKNRLRNIIEEMESKFKVN